ncbi:hypothetical protein M011DRAFT_464852 [Sporormia fimetaria CBS 119925]|uniref:Potassium channel domain-containing protein n=1 Tax=Sporormia fimetaria CBS 119925 TaxID=1340428 RepID=A0A6A6VJR8_9PLEO|nr:hypothetical protein M011DRAFT_464852 [Sporormia fimetaria CBS 119925]
MPYAVFGIIILGLVISSIYRFMRQLGTKNIVHKHMCRARDRTVSRAVSSSFDLRQREHQAHHLIRRRTLGVRGKPISSPFQPRAWSKKVVATTPLRLRPPLRQPKPIIMRQEKDRFDAMRAIQHRTREFSRWAAVCFSAFAYGVLWCVGAVVFWRCERNTQGMTYFEALYFCFISLLSIGYGDLAPESNAGRTFFVFWSLIAVPTMTILVSDMEDTFVSKFKKFSSDFADFTVLPRRGVWASFVKKRPWLLVWLKKEKAKKNVKRGFKTVDLDALEGREGEESRRQEEGGGGGGGEDADQAPDTHHGLPLNFHDLTSDTPTLPSAASLSLHLIRTLRYVSNDLRAPTPKQYSYEEWRYFTTLIRLAEDCTTTSTANPSHDPASEPTASESTENSAGSKEEGEEKKDAEQRDSAGVDWDWIGDDSPLLSGLGEPEWVSERLFKVLERLERVRARGEGGQVGAL